MIPTATLLESVRGQVQAGLTPLLPAVEFETDTELWYLVGNPTDDDDSWRSVIHRMLGAGVRLGARQIVLVTQVTLGDPDRPESMPAVLFVEIVNGRIDDVLEARYRINDTGDLDWELEMAHWCPECGGDLYPILSTFISAHDLLRVLTTDNPYHTRENVIAHLSADDRITWVALPKQEER